MGVNLFIIIVHLVVWLLCPLLLAQSVLPRGPFAQASTFSAPKHWDAGSLPSYLCCNVWPSLSSYVFMASSRGVLLFRRSFRILPVGPACFPTFSSPATFQLEANFSSFDVVRNNVTFSISCLHLELSLHIECYCFFLQT